MKRVWRILGWAALFVVISGSSCLQGPAGDPGTTTSSNAGTIVKTVPYPASITTVSDVIYRADDKTYWLLASNNLIPVELVQIDITTGNILATLQIQSPPAGIGKDSKVTWDGTEWWFTGSGWSSGVAINKLYAVDTTGAVVKTVDCPASSTGGFCAGIDWDGTYLWSAASDTKYLTRYLPDQSFIDPTTATFSTVGADDVTAVGTDIMVLKDGCLYQWGSSAMTELFCSANLGPGDWDGTYWWTGNDAYAELRAVFVR